MSKLIFVCLLIIIYQDKSHANLKGFTQILTWKFSDKTEYKYSLLEAIEGIISITNTLRSYDQYTLSNAYGKPVPRLYINAFITEIHSLSYNNENLTVKRKIPGEKSDMTASQVMLELDQWYDLIKNIDIDELSTSERNALESLLNPKNTTIDSVLLAEINKYKDKSSLDEDCFELLSSISNTKERFFLNPPSRKKSHESMVEKIAALQASKEVEKHGNKYALESHNNIFFPEKKIKK